MDKILEKNKVILGLSGGVDSTTAALLLKDKGLQVIGFYFDVLGNNTVGRREARQVADQLGIELIIKDVSDSFEQIVIGNFCTEYSKGRTPNPCVVCNPSIKFKELLQTANDRGAYYIATGHYAQVIYDKESNLHYIAKGANTEKDQSYMLYRLDEDVLKRLIFPLGDNLNKELTREKARKNNMINADKKDSQEICFIDDKKNYYYFLEEKGIVAPMGNFVNKEGKVLGKNMGISHYTIGQRKGLGIALGKPAFVTSIDSHTGDVCLGDNEDLFSREIISVDNYFTISNSNQFPKNYCNKEISAKIRYASKPQKAKLTLSKDGEVVTIFKEPQRAATPGQSIVFYDGDKVIGGGFIK